MKTVLVSSPTRTVSLSRYAPGERHSRHTDRRARISIVLSGGFHEECGDGVMSLGPGDVLLKSHAVAHADAFGAAGALILALEFAADDPFDAGAPPWRQLGGLRVARLATALLEAALARDPLGAEAAGDDLLAAESPPDPGARPAPPWLSRLREELETVGLARVDIAGRARDAGVHAAHASRLFRRCFGASITEHAQGHAVRRALSMMEGADAALSQVAAAAGFYDQSHMTRVFRRVTGRSPGARRGLSRRLAAIAG